MVVSMDVPQSLQRLVRTVMRGFYSIEHSLLMDLLLRKPCMRDEDLENLLKFDKKQINKLIDLLKKDKMLKGRIRMETGPDGKSSRQTYHYINYKAFVNVVKYKLDHMRRKIETEERDSTSRASFICTECKKAYTDLEADQLCDRMTGEFKCCNCGAVVEEDPNVIPQADSRLILARFNQQMEPLYILLKEVEDIVLPSEMAEPEPDSNNMQPGSNRNNDMRPTAVHIDTSGGDMWRSGQRRSEYDAMQVDASLTIKLESDEMDTNGYMKSENGLPTASSATTSVDGKKTIKKEQPAWLTTSTVDYESGDQVNGISDHHTPHSSTSIRRINEFDRMNGFSDPVNGDPASSSSLAPAVISKEVLETLMQYERESSDHFAEALNFLKSNHVIDHNNSVSAHVNGDRMDGENDALMESDDEEDEGPVVRVEGRLIPLKDVDESTVKRMSPEEVAFYIRKSCEIHSYLYD